MGHNHVLPAWFTCFFLARPRLNKQPFGFVARQAPHQENVYFPCSFSSCAFLVTSLARTLRDRDQKKHLHQEKTGSKKIGINQKFFGLDRMKGGREGREGKGKKRKEGKEGRKKERKKGRKEGRTEGKRRKKRKRKDERKDERKEKLRAQMLPEKMPKTMAKNKAKEYQVGYRIGFRNHVRIQASQLI